MDIPFSRIPHQSPLFLKYLDSSPEALRFYQRAPDIESILAVTAELNGSLYPRREVAALLRRQNESFGASSETLARIAELEKPDCVAVLTGQQVGLFTGPLYTVYKAITAVRLSEELMRRGVNAVPIFWMDTEDHDLPEVTRRTLLNPDSSIETVDYGRSLFGDAMPPFPVGSITIPGRIIQVLADYLERLPETRDKPELRSLLESACRAGLTLAQSFARLLTQVLRKQGLILFDPHAAEAKSLMTGVFRKALVDGESIRSCLIDRSKDLEASGFGAQVSIPEHSTPLFFFDDGQRRALEKRGEKFGLKNSSRAFSISQMAEMAAEFPERFSPNVLLRPIMQDKLFPTAAYVAGPSELAYFAQVEVLYRLYGRPMPVVWPRNSFTLISQEISVEMDRMGISLEDCLQGEEYVTEKVLRNSGASAAISGLEQLRKETEKEIAGIKPLLQELDPTLARAMETARHKILHNINRVHAQTVRFEGMQDAGLSKAVRLILNNCFPKGNLQERELDIFHFMVRHGRSIIDVISSETECGNFRHRVVRI